VNTRQVTSEAALLQASNDLISIKDVLFQIITPFVLHYHSLSDSGMKCGENTDHSYPYFTVCFNKDTHFCFLL